MNHEIFLRCHTRILNDKPQPKTSTRKSPVLAKYVLLIDTETTTDERQALNFGAYQFSAVDVSGNYLCREEGLFYADDLDRAQLETLKQYVKEKGVNPTRRAPNLRLYSRSEFVEKVMFRAIQAGAAIAAFNLPFDLSRLAVDYRVARGAGGRGWSFVLFQYRDKKTGKRLPNSFRPRVQLRPKDSKAAFIRLAGGDKNQPFRSGRFLDLKTIVWALRNRSMSLESACKEFKVPGKLDHTPTGHVSYEEIDYCRQDVSATAGLLNAVLAEFKSYPLGDLPPERAYSAASIAKAFLNTMGVISPMDKFQLTDEIAGICMQAYYGGRAEIRIRHTLVPVIYTDFTSQYPTVNTLLGLWQILTAEKLNVRDATDEVREFLPSLTRDDLLNPRTWLRLAFFGLVQPHDDIFPVRTIYGDGTNSDQTNIGLNPLRSAKPLWFAGPDIIGSFLLTGKVPRILRAIQLEPEGVQQGMRSVQLGNGSINPYSDDFFRKVIEERKSKHKSDPLYYFLKILANAGCYGIYAEVNRLQSGKNDRKKIGIFSGEENRTEFSCIVEAPGPWYFPPVSALITAGGRLLLAILERMVSDAGGTYLMCDTDSMAIVASDQEDLVPCKGGAYRTSDGAEAIKALSRAKVQDIINSFVPLNPYRNVAGSILNVVEELNFDSEKNPRHLWGWGNSAKRYVLGEFVDKELKLVKVSEHGLGLYYRPKEGRDPDCEVALWIKDGWQWILNRALGLADETQDWFSLPVMRRIAITTPNVMKALRKLSRDRARPYNFALSPVLINLTNTPAVLLGPFEKNSAKWGSMRYIDIHTGTVHKLNPPTLFAVPQTFEMKFRQYSKHPEYKSLAPDGNPCTSDTAGLLRRYPVVATKFNIVGKETERGWEQSEDISTLLPTLKHYGECNNSADVRLQTHLKQIPLSFLQDQTGLSRHTIVRARRGESIRNKSLKLLKTVVNMTPRK